jgi:hypothetical protein
VPMVPMERPVPPALMGRSGLLVPPVLLVRRGCRVILARWVPRVFLVLLGRPG